MRALHDAWRSLRAQPYGNVSAEIDLASAFLTLVASQAGATALGALGADEDA